MLRKDRIYETLRSLCMQRPAQSGVLRRDAGFSAEEVAERAQVDRTNVSRDLNLLAHEGKVIRIPGRPVLFTINLPQTEEQGASAWKSDGQSSSPPVVQQPDRSLTVPASVQVGTVVNGFDTLIGAEDGLKVAAQQAKAAVLYPPRGLHTLLCGPSGVGKTTFARLMHAYALELKTLAADAPFISFNCADYASMPQLLMAHLFGVVRGAYTGADHDREGLVEQAHRGILFLDEVHRLPPEGQEMLFHLMDRERFRRLGDVRERHASLLLLAATTEEPATALLPTFRRRIPMLINLPGLHERPLMERYALLRAFFTNECSSIGVNIHVDAQVLRALLVYDCPGNVGQLRTDVQLTCARAYLEYRTQNLEQLTVHSGVLPDHIRRSLLRTAELHRDLEPVMHLLQAAHVFTPMGLNLDSLPESAQDLYDTIGSDLSRLRRSGLSESEINRLLQLDIHHYFQRFADSVTHERPSSAANLIDERVAVVSREIVQSAQEQLKRVLPEKLALVLAMHLTSTLEHIAQGNRSMGLAIESVRHTYPKEYEVARTALAHIRSTLGVSLPQGETDVLAVLLANADALLSSEQSRVGMVVAAHGRGIAAGLAELANTLVGANFVRWVELTLEQSPDELLDQVNHWVRVADQGGGVLLLVDFTSLLSLGELVTRQTGIAVHTVAGVCAPLLIEATRRAQHSRNLTLEQLAASLAPVVPDDGTGNGHVFADEKTEPGQSPLHNGHHDGQAGRVILSICLTGFGSASKIAELIEERLPGLRKQRVEILCMDISLSRKTEDEVQRLIGNRHVVAVVGTINPHLESYPFIALTDFLFGDGITRLRTLLGGTLIDPTLLYPPFIEQHAPAVESLLGQALANSDDTPVFTRRSDLMREIASTLTRRLMFLNPVRIMPLIESMIELIEAEVGETFDIDVLAGLVLHIACILERGMPAGEMLVSETVRTQVEQQYARELRICRRAWRILGTQIARPLPDEEAYNIVGILRQVDIFNINVI